MADHINNVKFAHFQINRIVVKGVEQQQAFGQLVQPVRLIKDDVKITILQLRRNCAIQDRLDVSFD